MNMKHLNKYHWLIIVSITLFYFCCLIDWKNEENISYHPLEVIDNEIRVKETKEVLYRFIPVDGGEMEFDYIDKLDYNDSLIEVHNSFKKDINSFLMGETPVTRRLWDYVMKDSLRKKLNEKALQNFLVYYIDSVSALGWKVFIDSLEDLTGYKFTLPSSFQWEYAARGGNKSKNYVYSGSDNIDEVAMYNTFEGIVTSTGKQKKNNELGFYDMSGGVWELTTTEYGEIFPWKRMFFIEENYGFVSLGISRGGDIHSSANKCAVRNIDVENYSYFTGARLILVTNNQTIPAIKYRKDDCYEPTREFDVLLSEGIGLQHIKDHSNKTNHRKDGSTD